jgi:hypothetical protein
MPVAATVSALVSTALSIGAFAVLSIVALVVLPIEALVILFSWNFCVNLYISI